MSRVKAARCSLLCSAVAGGCQSDRALLEVVTARRAIPTVSRAIAGFEVFRRAGSALSDDTLLTALRGVLMIHKVHLT